jgi:hypothetical protein
MLHRCAVREENTVLTIPRIAVRDPRNAADMSNRRACLLGGRLYQIMQAVADRRNSRQFSPAEKDTIIEAYSIAIYNGCAGSLFNYPSLLRKLFPICANHGVK